MGVDMSNPGGGQLRGELLSNDFLYLPSEIGRGQLLRGKWEKEE